MKIIGNSWDEVLKEEFESENFKKIENFLNEEYEKNTVYPQRKDIFNAFKLTPYEEVKVVILGQDPYHNYGEAQGLSFSVNNNIKMPPSLRNIYKEIEAEFNEKMDYDKKDLSYLGRQGVFLINTILTVRENQPLSHKDIGWENFTDGVIRKISEREKPVVFFLWGRKAMDKKVLIKNPKDLILESNHPSPLSATRGVKFFGHNHFKKANEFLEKNNLKKINWINN